jgi:hypothetical protein
LSGEEKVKAYQRDGSGRRTLLGSVFLLSKRIGIFFAGFVPLCESNAYPCSHRAAKTLRGHIKRRTLQQGRYFLTPHFVRIAADLERQLELQAGTAALFPGFSLASAHFISVRGERTRQPALPLQEEQGCARFALIGPGRNQVLEQ